MESIIPPADAPETKSAADDTIALIGRMLVELRQQFLAVRRIRLDAGRAGQAAEGDEALIRQARADLKLALDAFNMIVRTLEKLEDLRTGLESDRQTAEDVRLAEAGLAEGRARLAELVNRRIDEEVARRLATCLAEEGGADSGPDTGPEPGPGDAP